MNCLNIGFIQHEGECWHDSLLTILLLSNEFGDNIQKILLHEDIETIITKPKLYKFLLPININYDDKSFCKFEEYSKIYLINIKKRLESKLRESSSADPSSYKPRPLERQNSYTTSSCSSNTLLDIYNINNINKKIGEISGDDLTDIITIQFYNYFFQTDNKFINFNEYSINTIINIDPSIIEKSHCAIITINWKNKLGHFVNGHIVSLFKCKINSKTNYYYYDNMGQDGQTLFNDEKGNEILKNDYKVFHKYDWKTVLSNTPKHLLFDTIFNDIKEMSCWLKSEETTEYKLSIGYIRLLYYDNFVDETEYYNKISPSISIWFYNNFLISNRISELDTSIKSNLFPKIKEYFDINQKLMISDQLTMFDMNYNFHNIDLLERDNEDLMAGNIGYQMDCVYYLSNRLKQKIIDFDLTRKFEELTNSFDVLSYNIKTNTELETYYLKKKEVEF